MLEGLLHQLGARLHAEVLHDRIFVKGHRCALLPWRRSAISFSARGLRARSCSTFALPGGKLLRGRLVAQRRENTEDASPLVTRG